jgi:hypothetical protein
MTERLKLVVLKVAGEFLFLFGLLAWVYGVLVQLIHPEWLPLSLSHLIAGFGRHFYNHELCCRCGRFPNMEVN